MDELIQYQFECLECDEVHERGMTEHYEDYDSYRLITATDVYTAAEIYAEKLNVESGFIDSTIGEIQLWIKQHGSYDWIELFVSITCSYTYKAYYNNQPIKDKDLN